MKKTLSLAVLLTLLYSLSLTAQKQLSMTSFETTEGYVSGAINNQNKWKTTTGTAIITAEPEQINTGAQGLNLSSSTTTLQSELYGYTKDEIGLQGTCYLDGYVKIQSLSTGNFAIALYDITPNNSAKRSLMIELLTPSAGSGKIKIYSGGSGSSDGTYNLNEWVRISAQIDLDGESSKVAINGIVINKTYSFRETWTPASLGRPSGEKEVHSIRLSTTSSANTNIAIDDLYVGETPIADISFGESATDRTITLSQPAVGVITLTPQKSTYQVGDEVTASCTLPLGYKLTGWSDDLNGTTSNPTTFTVSKNMTIGATTNIDPQNPPARFEVRISQPDHATISVSPESPDGLYYAHTALTFKINTQPCYRFDGWNGSLSGNSETQTTTLTANMDVSATIAINQTIPVVHRITTANEWKMALNTMNPGDEIIVANGTYDLGGITITRSGCQERPILIHAENIGGVTLINKSSFNLRDVEYITFEGFIFQSKDVTVFKVESSRYCRITRNVFRLEESTSVKWILIGSYYQDTELKSWNNRIDHNLFENKSQGGNFITIDGCQTAAQQSQYDCIDHNHFRNNTPRAANEKETIRVGVSGLSFSDGFTTIEYNLFEDCDGDPEIVSIKSCSNTIRYNTFRRCLGTLSFRQGFRNRAESNYFFGESKTGSYNGGTIGCGGIRVYSKDHVIINNYMEGLTGEKWDPAIAITNGDVENSSSTQSAHFLPENVLVSNNTIINCKSNIEIGFDNNGNYGKAPKNCRIENNIIVSEDAPIIKSYSQKSLDGVSFTGNIFYPTASASMGINNYTDEQIRNTNPLLIYSDAFTFTHPELIHSQKLYKLTAESPGINNSINSVATLDFEGQPRIGLPDVGADELSNTPITMGPLTATNVGPHATDYVLQHNSSSALQSTSANAFSIHYDKQSAILIIHPHQHYTSVRVEVIDIAGKALVTTLMQDKNPIRVSLQNANKGIYMVRCIPEMELNPTIWTRKFNKQ